MPYPFPELSEEELVGLYDLGQPFSQPLTKPQPLIKPMGGIPKPTITLPSITPSVETKPLSWWERSLQVFAAPFNWVDDYIIQPGLSLLGTTMGFVSELERGEGEDYWEWKRRSWAGWKAPGVNINIPWSDEDWRIDVKGILEVAPWLLIPGAGQVGGVTAKGVLGGVKTILPRIAGKAGALEREAVGLTGKLGQLETVGQKTVLAGTFKGLAPVGRVVGTAFEYSPWGLAEKTLGKVIKGGIKTTGLVSGRVSTAVAEKLWGKIPELPPPSPVVAKFTKYTDEVVGFGFKEFKEAKPELRVKQLEIIDKYNTMARNGEIHPSEATPLAKKEMARRGLKENEFLLTSGALRARQVKAIEEVEAGIKSGKITKELGDARIAKIKENPAYTAVPFIKDDTKELLNMLDEAIEKDFSLFDSKDALTNLLVNNLLPEPRHFKQWASVYGKDFAIAVNKFIKLSPSARAQVIDALNLPRAVLATLDLSATFRQGLILALVRPQDVPKAFIRQLKFFASEKMSLEMDDLLRSRPLYREAVKNGVDFTAVRRGAIPSFKEEPFFSNIAENIPFVRRSERAFSGYLNEMRMSAFEAGYGAMTAQGATKAQFDLLGDFINFASGRGTLPYNAEKYAPFLSTVLFSPRYQASTLGLPIYLGKMLLSKNPYLRKQAALALATFAGGGSALLGLLNATGVAKVEGDPRSVDFGKIRFRDKTTASGWSETRIDIWRGYIQYARFAAQMLTGEKKSAYGNLNKEERLNTAMRFAQSKSSPAAGLILDLWRGESYMGKPLFNETTGFIGTVKEHLLPLVIQDVMDAVEMQGANGIWKAIPATLGIGILTQVNDLVIVQNKIAREMGYEAWNKIDPKTQREIENTNVELQVAQISLDRQMMGTAWGDWQLAGKAIESVFKVNVENAVNEYRETGDGYTFREKINDAFTARRGGFDAREKEERFSDIVNRLKNQDLVGNAIELGPEQMAIRAYYDALFGEDMYDEFNNYRFEEAQVRQDKLRQQLGEEMFDYIEEYRGLKNTDLPPEFQELSNARRILKPYWEVKADADKYFGKEDNPRKSSFIKRHRDALKRSNPIFQYYLDLFYKRRD